MARKTTELIDNRGGLNHRPQNGVAIVPLDRESLCRVPFEGVGPLPTDEANAGWCGAVRL